MKKYQDVKVEDRLWGMNIPTRWDVKPLFGIGKIKSITNCENMELLSIYLDLGVIPFSTKVEKRTNTTSSDLSKYQRVDIGDFVLNNQQAWRGSVGVSNYEGIVSPAYLIVTLDNSLQREYANYLFRSKIMVSQYLINSKGVGSIQRNLYWQALKRIAVPIPTKEEQIQIVNYLN
jgi:type I restriction enzyme S subunit